MEQPENASATARTTRAAGDVPRWRYHTAVQVARALNGIGAVRERRPEAEERAAAARPGARAAVRPWSGVAGLGHDGHHAAGTFEDRE